MFILEPFQHEAKANIAMRFKQAKRVLLQSATGSGKTVIAVDFIKDWLDANPGKTVLCLFNLQVLLPQFEESFTHHGLRHEVSLLHDTITRAKDLTRMVDHKVGCNRRILLTLPETYVGVMEGRGAGGLEICPDFAANIGLILIDEAHKGTSDNFQRIRDAYDAQVLGLTATPMRVKNKDGESLREWYEDQLVVTISILELIDMKRLVQPLYYDLDQDAHLYMEWKKAVAKSNDDGNEQTLWFVRDTAHAKDWEDKLLEAGESVEIITSVDDADLGTTSQTPIQRQEIYDRFARKETKILISVRALCEGFDSPIAKYCVIDRGIGNKALYQQIVGRVIRTFDGKANGHIIDRGGNRRKHGDVEDYTWDLSEEDEGITIHLDNAKVISMEKHERATKVMVKCETVGCTSTFDAKRLLACPHCSKTHSLEIEAPAVVWMSHAFPTFNPDQHPKIYNMIAKAVKGDEWAMNQVVRMAGNVFNPDLTFATGYGALSSIMDLKPKTVKDFKKVIRIAA